MLQHLPSIPVVVAALIAALTSFSRVFEATRPGWCRLPAWAQTLAPLLLTAAGGIVAGLAGVTTSTDLMVVIVAGVFSVLPGAPSNRSAAPMQAGKPVTGTPSAGDHAVVAVVNAKNAKAAPPPAPPSGMSGGSVAGSIAGSLLVIVLSFHSVGCAWFKGSFWPNVEKCAPSSTTLIAQVTQVMEAGGDYETALEQLALTDGKDLVLCAVQAFVNSIGSKAGASTDEMAGVARGKAFLAEHPVGQ
jgi:hypothetical protein